MKTREGSVIIQRTSEGKFIFSKRAKDKYPYPNTWACGIGGGIEPGESPVQAAIRESLEEAELSLEEKDLEKIAEASHVEKDLRYNLHVFTTKHEINPNDLKPDPGEIQYFKAFTLKEVEARIKEDPEAFAPTFRAAFAEFIKNIN